MRLPVNGEENIRTSKRCAKSSFYLCCSCRSCSSLLRRRIHAGCMHRWLQCAPQSIVFSDFSSLTVGRLFSKAYSGIFFRNKSGKQSVPAVAALIDCRLSSIRRANSSENNNGTQIPVGADSASYTSAVSRSDPVISAQLNRGDLGYTRRCRAYRRKVRSYKTTLQRGVFPS
jgi:hypothetical protein